MISRSRFHLNVNLFYTILFMQWVIIWQIFPAENKIGHTVYALGHFFYIEMLITVANYPCLEWFPFNFDFLRWTEFIACIIISLSLLLVYLSMITSSDGKQFSSFWLNVFSNPHQAPKEAADTYLLD